MKRINLLTIIISTIILTSFFVSCAVNPVTGKRELMLISESKEISLGQSTDKQIIQMYGLYRNETLHKYINDMGQKMAKICHRPNLNFSFKVMDDPVINAFAVPGGYVYVTRGILAYLNNEAELAGVLGHEIGHITARHSAKQISKSQLTQIGIGLGSVLSEDFANYSGLIQQGVGLLFLKFSRDNEREADDLGVEYSSKIGYNAKEMANFFTTLDRMHSDSKGRLPDWLSTHPNPEDRVGAVRREAEKKQKELNMTSYAVNQEKYLSTINGIIFGEDPRQGFTEKNNFYHPELKFQFPYPEGWELQNLPAQIQIASKDKKAIILFTLEKETTTDAAAQNFIAQNKMQEVSRTNTKVNELSTIKLESKRTDQSGTIQILSYFIKKQNQIYAFHGVTSASQFSSYKDSFQNTMNGFRTLIDKSKLNVKPDRIRVKNIKGSMTLQDALKKLGVKEKDLNKLALINGKELNEILPANTKLKIIEKGL